MMTLEQLSKSRLARLEYFAAGSIWSLRMSMAGDRESPVFGTKNMIDKHLHIHPDDEITSIRMLESSDKKYLNAIEFHGHHGKSDQPSEEKLLYSIPGADFTGTWHTHKLNPGEQILGLYGWLNSAPNIRGVGFIVWTPLN